MDGLREHPGPAFLSCLHGRKQKAVLLVAARLFSELPTRQETWPMVRRYGFPISELPTRQETLLRALCGGALRF